MVSGATGVGSSHIHGIKNTVLKQLAKENKNSILIEDF